MSGYNKMGSLKYKYIYRESLNVLKENLKAARLDDENTYVVALSRKGPRLLEFLFGKELFQNAKIITEHALPLFFKSLRTDIEYRFVLIDDAIYFGSTIEGVYNTIVLLKDYYHVSSKEIAYVAIHSVESKTINDLQIIPDVNVPAGFGHYFVKNVMADIRSRRAPIEVDFPCFTIHIKTEATFEKLLLEFSNLYPQRVYKVSHKECESINVLLHDVQGSFFNKLRIYVDGKNLHIVPMTPRVIADSNDSIQQRFQYAQKGLDVFWKQLIANYSSELQQGGDTIRRNLVKSLVLLANYIYSCNTFLQEYDTIIAGINSNFGIEGDIILNNTELSLLLGDLKLFEELRAILVACLQSKTPFVEYGINLFKFSENPVYESYNYPTSEEKELLRNRDHVMIANCQNITQALSAIFFNQNLLIERWSRDSIFTTSSRLNFGYTFFSLNKQIEDYRGKFSRNERDLLTLHAWVDERIEQGCIVPQYVCDISNHIWTRVFRPGENEDRQLSHLTRWVVSVYNKISELTGITDIPKAFLDEMLSYLIVQMPILSEEIGINLIVDKNHDEGQEGRRNTFFIDDAGQKTNLCNYMENMYILAYQNSNYTISKYLSDNDIKQYTTLGDDIKTQQDELISSVIADFKTYFAPYHLQFLIFNYYYKDTFDLNEFSERISKCAESLNEMLYQIEANFRGKDFDRPLLNMYGDLVKCFTLLLPYIMSIGLFFGSNKVPSLFEGKPSLADLERKSFLLSALINVVHSAYCVKDVSLLKSYLNNIQDYYDYLKMHEVWSILKPMIEESLSDQASKSRTLLLSIRSAINNSILK